MPEKNYIQPHSHCRVCGEAISDDEDFCSKEHEGEYKDKRQRQKRIKYVFYALIAIWLVFILASNFIIGG